MKGHLDDIFITLGGQDTKENKERSNLLFLRLKIREDKKEATQLGWLLLLYKDLQH